MIIVYKYILLPIILVITPILRLFFPKFNTRERTIRKLDKIDINTNFPRIWFHASSMGEFEQVKPIIEKLKSSTQNIFIICTFFSPSGYENQKNYKYADLITYLPLDSKKNAKKIVQDFSPDIFVLDRYDLWLNNLEEIKKSNAKMLLINATKPNISSWLSPILSGFYKNLYSFFDYIYTLSDNDFNYFKEINIKSKIIKSSDTRFDRIIEAVENSNKLELIPNSVINGKKVFVAGSIWQEDEDIILDTIKQYSNQNNISILVPHEPTKEHCDKLLNQLPSSILLSKITGSENSKFIIVDSIGKLLGLYSLADFAYIGGGFGIGVHSVTEAAGYGIPLSCGRNYYNSPDAVNLYSEGALRIINSKKDFEKFYSNSLEVDSLLTKSAKKAKDYVYRNKGKSVEVYEKILGLLNIS